MNPKTSKLTPSEAIAEGEKALMLEVSKNMSKETKLKMRETYLRQGVPKSTVNKLFPDLPPVK